NPLAVLRRGGHLFKRHVPRHGQRSISDHRRARAVDAGSEAGLFRNPLQYDLLTSLELRSVFGPASPDASCGILHEHAWRGRVEVGNDANEAYRVLLIGLLHAQLANLYNAGKCLRTASLRGRLA